MGGMTIEPQAESKHDPIKCGRRNTIVYTEWRNTEGLEDGAPWTVDNIELAIEQCLTCEEQINVFMPYGSGSVIDNEGKVWNAKHRAFVTRERKDDNGKRR
jgi:hypothetical protein